MKKIMVLIILPLMTNCLTFRKNELAKYPSPVSVTTPVAKKLTYKLDFTSDAIVNGNNDKHEPVFVDERKKQLDAVIEETGLLIPASDANGEYTIRYYIKEVSSANQGVAFLFGFTGGLIPMYIGTELNSELEVKNKAGKTLGKIERKESFSMWGQLLFIFVAPFQRPLGKIEDIYRDQMRSSFEEAIAKKYFGNYAVNPQPNE
ncbi:MAG: hypothetical protein O9264_16335 [Leptospira sp.]|nr:hypothetical protein [Leptospira sp.]